MSIVELKHAYTEISDGVGVSHSADTNFTLITGATIAASQFNPGEKYLIIIDSDVQGLTGGGDNDQFGFRVKHGSTVFPGSQKNHTHFGIEGFDYRFFVVWTAIAGEAITCEFKTNNTAAAVVVNHLGMFALELSVRLTEDKDWFFVEDFTVTAYLDVFPGFLEGPTLSFTPDEDSDWLILSEYRSDQNIGLTFGGPREMNYRINNTGDFTEIKPVMRRFTLDDRTLNGEYVLHLARTLPLTKKKNTFIQQEQHTSGTRQYAAIFALNLSKFIAHAINRNDNRFVLTEASPGYDTLENSLNITPEGIQDVWFGTSIITIHDLLGAFGNHRTQIDQVDAPPGQTTTNFRHPATKNGFPSDEFPGYFARSFVDKITKKVLLEVEGNNVSANSASHIESVLWALQLSIGKPSVALSTIRAKNEPTTTATKHGVTSQGV